MAVEFYESLSLPNRCDWYISQNIKEWANNGYVTSYIPYSVSSQISISDIKFFVPIDHTAQTNIINLSSDGSSRIVLTRGDATSSWPSYDQTFDIDLYLNNTPIGGTAGGGYTRSYYFCFFKRDGYASIVCYGSTERWPNECSYLNVGIPQNYKQAFTDFIENNITPTYTWQSVPTISGKNVILNLSTLNDINDGNPITTSDASKINFMNSSSVSKLVNDVINN